MESRRWERIEDIFHKALLCAPADREAYLTNVCGGDKNLREEVESLISSFELPGDFLGQAQLSAGLNLYAARDSHSLAGELIGPYTLESRIGRGGMGDVYLARDQRLGRPVALKVLPASFGSDSEWIARFRQEARAASSISHPNIAHIYEVGAFRGQQYIAMEFIEGITLRERLKRGRVGLDEAVDIGLQVARALAAAHTAGVLHRDVKPENIMLRADGFVKVLDFGLAKLNKTTRSSANGLDSFVDTQPGIVMGTVAYMSPEQARGLGMTAQSDIWSLGVVLYEMVTSGKPFTGETPSDVIASILLREPPSILHYQAEFPAALDLIISKTLQKDATARHPGMDKLAEDLNAIRQELGSDSGRTASLRGALQLSSTPMVAEPGSPTIDLRTATSKGTTQSGAGNRMPAISFTNEKEKSWPFVSKFLTGTFKLVPAQKARIGIQQLLTFRGLIKVLAPVVTIGFLFLWSIHYFSRPRPHHPSPDAIKLYNQGSNSLLAGDLYLAVYKLTEATKLDDQFLLAHASLAQAWCELDYMDKARSELLRLRSLAPDRSVLSSTDVLYLEAIEATIEGDFDKAVNRYNQIASVSHSESTVFVHLGRSYEMSGQLDNAITAYIKATQLDPSSVAASLRLGIAYSRKKDVAKAIVAFDEADNLSQSAGDEFGYVEVLHQRSLLAESVGRTEEARSYDKQALTSFKGFPFETIRVEFHLACIEYPRGKNHGEIHELQAVDLAQSVNRTGLLTHGADELLARGLVDIGNMFLLRDQLQEAQDYFWKATHIAQRSNLKRTMARVLFAQGQLSLHEAFPDEADGKFKQALKIVFPNKSFSDASIALWRNEILDKDYDSAILTFKRRILDTLL